MSSTMKAEGVDDGGDRGVGVTPCHCYYWLVTLDDDSVVPEYDLGCGMHHSIHSIPAGLIKRFCWMPVTLGLMDGVRRVFGEELMLPDVDQGFCLDVDLVAGERLRRHPLWRNTVSFLGRPRVCVRYGLFKVMGDGRVCGVWLCEDGRTMLDGEAVL